MVDEKDKGNFTFFTVRAPEKHVKEINPRNFTMFSINNGVNNNTERPKNSINISSVKRSPNPSSYNFKRYSSYTYFKTRYYEQQYTKSKIDSKSKSNDILFSEKTKLNLRKVIRRFNNSKLFDQITLFGKYIIRGLIDTGADVSLIDYSFAKKIGIKAGQNKGIIIKDLNKSRIPAGHCTISVTSIRNYSLGIDFDFYVYENLHRVIGVPLLIGMNVVNEISNKYGGFIIPPIEESSNNASQPNYMDEKKKKDIIREENEIADVLIIQSFSDNDVENWIELYKKLGSFEKVRTELFRINNKVPSLRTVFRRVPEYLGKENYKKLVGGDKPFLKKERTRWSFLNWSKNGKPRTKEKAILNASKYLKKNILTKDFMSKHNLSLGQAPTTTHLSEGNNDFIGAIYSRDLEWDKILECADLTRTISKRWSFMNWSKEKIPRTKEKALENAAAYLKANILTKKFRTKSGFVKNNAPSSYFLTQNKHHQDFISALEKRKLTYEDILKKAGLQKKSFRWAFLDFDSKGNNLDKNGKIIKATNYFLQKILTNDFKKKYDIGDGETPTIQLLNKAGFQDFLSAISYRDIKYNDLIEKTGLIPNEFIVYSKIGTDFHWIAEYLFIKNTRAKNYLSFYETFPSFLSKTGHGKKLHLNHCDNTIIVDENLRRILTEIVDIPKDIVIINIDYFLGTSMRIIKGKCLKGYQGKYKMLILVPLNATQPLETPENIPHRKNVKVLDPKSFTKFFEFTEDINKQFLLNVNLAKKAVYIETNRKVLKSKSIEFKKLLRSSLNYSQNELKGYLKSINRLDLLEYDNDHLDKWI